MVFPLQSHSIPSELHSPCSHSIHLTESQSLFRATVAPYRVIESCYSIPNTELQGPCYRFTLFPWRVTVAPYRVIVSCHRITMSLIESQCFLSEPQCSHRESQYPHQRVKVFPLRITMPSSSHNVKKHCHNVFIFTDSQFHFTKS